MKINRICRRAGFSLIELLVVITILSLLAGIVYNRVSQNIDKAKVAEAKTQIQNFSNAVEQFHIDTQKYPTTQQGLTSLITNPGADGWQGPYMQKSAVPKDPWGKEYQYVSPGVHGDFDISSLGKDGTVGGDGYNKDINSWE